MLAAIRRWGAPKPASLIDTVRRRAGCSKLSVSKETTMWVRTHGNLLARPCVRSGWMARDTITINCHIRLGSLVWRIGRHHLNGNMRDKCEMGGRVNLAFLAFCCCLLGACAPVISTDDLRYTDNSNNYEIEIDKEFQESYEKILETARKCHEKLLWGFYPIPDRLIVDGKADGVLKKGHVSVVIHPGIVGDGATIAVLVIDISDLGGDKTKLVVYSEPHWNRAANAVRTWISGDPHECVSEE